MTFRVQVTDEARRQLFEIDEWWTQNRPKAPDLVHEEFARVISLLAATPSAGRVHIETESATYRRLLLRRSRFHVYYVIDESARVVVVTAIWNGARGHGPVLT